MRTVYVIIFFVLMTSIFSELQAQNDFAILEKNVNIRAKNLTQKLNITKDTLLLKSNTLINKVYAVNMNYKREVNLTVREKSVKIPLKKLSKGKHVFVAVQSPVRIVFVVKILRDNSVLLALEEDKMLSKNE
ncbi:hypothetical protein [Psychroserpens ponticola]|uniref:DUF4138 domain-containing protein n=1 Tax=Psychroserpens ponticola TaxID=2932268 RepID=A0ABY7RVU6_9FLAO|nr:hypothetical protein [Psychroserpens ponticola]WCO00815.1 hypothetical protein MUN68_012150 [Psychroserpens ponticola]